MAKGFQSSTDLSVFEFFYCLTSKVYLMLKNRVSFKTKNKMKKPQTTTTKNCNTVSHGGHVAEL